MGNFEKLVVLTVLFVAAIVLAISLNRGGDEVEAANPLSGAQQALAPDQGGPALDQDAGLTPEPSKPAPVEGAQGTSLLLNAGAEAQPSATKETATGASAPVGLAPTGLSLEPQPDTSSRILRDTAGLRPSFAEDYMVYTAMAGDTWSGLAQRFYQDGRYTRNLRQANDDLSELVTGSAILVPVFDFLASEPVAEPAAETAPSGGAAFLADQSGAKHVDARTEVAPVGAAAQTYEVRSGDTLSDISVAVFGTATRWKDLLDANQDVLKKPEGLQVGMKLKVPAGGKVPDPATVAKKSAPRASEPKPKTTTAATTPPKKKKVL